MRVLIIGHAYAAGYNRKDKLSRIAKDARIEELAVVVPRNWYDRMMKVPRRYEKIPEDELYQVGLFWVFPSGVQSKYLLLPWALHRLVQDFDPDIIHVEQELRDWVLWEVAFLNRRFWHKPLSVFVWENLRRNFGVATRFFVRKLFSNSKGLGLLIGGNREAIEIAQEQGFCGRAVVIPQFGVDEDRFKPIEVGNLRRKLGLEDKFVIGFVGRYVKEKGIQTLVKALGWLQGNFVALFISSMSPPRWLKEEAGKLGHRVRFLERIPHEEFPQYMNLFDVLVLPSETQKDWKEQFGRVMIEAMACGVPVVGSSSGAIPEVIDGVGIVFEEGNAKDLARKLTFLQRNSGRLKQLTDRARPYVLENYTHDRVVERTITEWEKLLRG